MNFAAERLPLNVRRSVFWTVHRKLGGQLGLLASGGAPLAAETQQLWERLGVRVVQGYGTSECSPIIACGAPDGSTPSGSVGKPIVGVEVQLSSEGELLVSGPNVMRGYWHDPARTAEVLCDGRYATGDLARIDERGNIWLAGRARDLIVLPSGLNVWPQDVEDELRQEAAVADAAVVAVPRPGGGESLHAYLIPTSGAARESDLSALVARCNGHLAQHQRLASASWWGEPDFPRTLTLKVRRHLLPIPEQIQTVQVESVLAADDPVAQAVAGAARTSAVKDDQTLGELGLDSLGLVDLALALEDKTGKIVADSDLRLDMTLAQVRTFVGRATELEGEQQGPVGPEVTNVEQPLWPYTWGRAFRFLSFPVDLLYQYAVTRTVVLGAEHLRSLPARVIVAGTHHGFADLPLVRYGLSHSASRGLVRRLVVATGAMGFATSAPFAKLGILALGLYPLHQYGEREASLRRLAQLADAGNAVLIFPQGTHARPEQECVDDPAVRFRPGIGHLAAALDAAVIPFGLAGTERLIPPFVQQFKGRVVAGFPVSLTRGPLAIAFGPPVTLSPGEDPAVFAARLQAVCYCLTRDSERALVSRTKRSTA
jgi:long-chain acyl-CoA synthetase